MNNNSYRRPRPINREIEHVRDTSLIIIATEGEKTEKLYFSMDSFKHKKIQIRIISTNDGSSSPKDVLDRLHKEATEYQFRNGDQFWLVIDKDRWTDDMLREIIGLCKDSDYQVALSNPCFELWLLLHLQIVENLHLPKNMSPNQIKTIFNPIIDKRNKGNYTATYAHCIPQALKEARKLDRHPDAPYPDCPGTRVYRLVEELIE